MLRKHNFVHHILIILVTCGYVSYSVAGLNESTSEISSAIKVHFHLFFAFFFFLVIINPVADV